MRANWRWLVLFLVMAGSAGLSAARHIYEPEVSRDAAVAQMQHSDDAVQQHRAVDLLKHDLDWAWIAVPIAAVALFGGDVVRFCSQRERSVT